VGTAALGLPASEARQHSLCGAGALASEDSWLAHLCGFGKGGGAHAACVAILILSVPD
jgi:hypothetical protein